MKKMKNKINLILGISIFSCANASAATDTGTVTFKATIAETCSMVITAPSAANSILFSKNKLTTVPGGFNQAYVKLSSNKASPTLSLNVTSKVLNSAKKISGSQIASDKAYVLFKSVSGSDASTDTNSLQTGWAELNTSQKQVSGEKFAILGGVVVDKTEVMSGDLEIVTTLTATCS